MNKIIVSLVLVFLLMIPKTQAADPPQSEHLLDIREVQLYEFFQKYHCTKSSFDLIPEYVEVANKYDLPFSLLPAISVMESSCGKHYRYNNLWGWNSARTGFGSFKEGLDFVALQLATGRPYKNKTITQKLHTYCPSPTYPTTIKRLMSEAENPK